MKLRGIGVTKVRNLSAGKILGNVATPVAVVTNDGTKKIYDKAIATYLVSDADIASGRFKLDGNASECALPVILAGENDKLDGGELLPIYPVSGSFGVRLSFVFQDWFQTQRAAGAVNGTDAEPGPGVRTCVDTNSLITINASGQLQVSGTPAANDRVYVPASLMTRAPGLACAIDFVSGSISGASAFGWLNAAGGGIACIAGNNYGDTNSDNVGIGFSSGKTAMVVLRAAGAYYIVKSGSTYTLYWEDTDGGSGNAVVGVACAAVSHNLAKFDNFRVMQLPEPWVSTYGLCTTALVGVRAANDIFTHQADFLGDCRFTALPTAGQIQIAIRMQDDNNYWRIDVNPDGSGALQEVVNGTPTSRATCVAGSFGGGGTKTTFRAYGSTIVVARIGLQKMLYASATNFQTATQGKILSLGTGGAITGMFTYPRIISGAALSSLSQL